MNEQWKPAPGFESDYAISNHGRFKRTSSGRHTQPGRIIKPSWAARYLGASASCDGIVRRIRVHKLVAEAFVPKPEDPAKSQINHIDGDRSNNRADNLEWVTAKENSAHAWKMGLSKASRGEDKGNAKLTNVQAEEIRALRGQISGKELASRYGVSRATICQIQLGNQRNTH